MDPEGFAVEVDGGALVGHRGGEGRPALVLHGGPAIPDYTGALAAELDGLLATVRYTQRGTPPSGGGPPYTVETHMADALAVLDRFGIERAWVVGHSWGGFLALQLAVSHPERVAGLVCIGTLGAADIFDEQGANLARGLTADQVARIVATEERRRRGEATEADLVDRFALVWPQFFADPSQAGAIPAAVGVRCSGETNASIASHFERRTLARGLPNVRAPALFVHGEQDALPVRSSLETAALIDGARVETIPDCGHFPWLEHPGAVRDAVARFLPRD
jgi:proline iminopeptidase